MNGEQIESIFELEENSKHFRSFSLYYRKLEYFYKMYDFCYKKLENLNLDEVTLDDKKKLKQEVEDEKKRGF